MTDRPPTLRAAALRAAALGSVLALTLGAGGQAALAHGDEEHSPAPVEVQVLPTGSPGPILGGRVPLPSCLPTEDSSTTESSPPTESSGAPSPGSEAPDCPTVMPSSASDEHPASTASLPPAALQASGIVLSVDSPALGRVDSFVLLTNEGEQLTFSTSELPFDAAFPVSHIAEHQMTTDPVKVTYIVAGDRLRVVALADAHAE